MSDGSHRLPSLDLMALEATFTRNSNQFRFFTLRNAVGDLDQFFRHFQGHLQLIFPVRGHLMPEFGVQTIQGIFRNLKCRSDILKSHVFFGLDFFKGDFFFQWLAEIHTVFYGILDDLNGCQKTRHIACRFIGQLMIEVPEPVQIIQMLTGNYSEYPAFAAVVGSQDGQPIAKHVMQILQITDGGTG